MEVSKQYLGPELKEGISARDINLKFIRIWKPIEAMVWSKNS